jgi:hypothetical protein
MRAPKAAPALAFLLACCVLLAFAISCYAAEHITVYKLGDGSTPHWDTLKRHLQKKGYRVSMYDGATTIEKHVENVNRINREKAMVFLALDLRAGERMRAVAAIDDSKGEPLRFATIREVSSSHRVESQRLAGALAAPFGASVKELSLFPLLGVDMPGLFLHVEYAPDGLPAALDMLYEGLQKYFGRSSVDES